MDVDNGTFTSLDYFDRFVQAAGTGQYHFIFLCSFTVRIRATAAFDMAHLLSKGKEQVTQALEAATAAMSVDEQKKPAGQQPKPESSQGASGQLLPSVYCIKQSVC